MTGTAIKTNGERQPCTSHLNLTRTMADVQRDRANSIITQMKAAKAKIYQTYERLDDAKVQFAGKDRP